MWEEFRGENLEFRELPGDRVLLLGELVVQGKASGVEIRSAVRPDRLRCATAW